MPVPSRATPGNPLPEHNIGGSPTDSPPASLPNLPLPLSDEYNAPPRPDIHLRRRESLCSVHEITSHRVDGVG
jgi:hypothetical protein